MWKVNYIFVTDEKKCGLDNWDGGRIIEQNERLN